jgi:hypothetical protein
MINGEKINGKKYRIFPGQSDPLAEHDFYSRTLLPTGTAYEAYDTSDEVVAEIVDNGKFDVPALPSVGTFINVDELYQHDGNVYRVRQSHNVTIYDPDDVPALFTIYRNPVANMEWIAGEQVDVGVQRDYNGKAYEVMQAHQTQIGWEPDTTVALWKEVQGEEYPVWVQPTGGHDAYAIDAIVWFPTEGSTLYKSLIDANVWSPTVYPAGWEVYTEI